MAYNAKTNWQLNDIVRPEDMIRIEQGIKDLDVGKLTKTAVKVSAGQNLDTFVEVGIYTWSGGDSSSIVNCPITGQATMIVLPRLLNYSSASNTENVTQFVISQISSRTSAGMWVRMLVDKVWTGWTQISTGADFASVAKYNLATATKTSLGSIESTVNPLPTDWTQVTEGTKYTKNGFTISSADWYPSGPSPIKNAFDGNTDTLWRSAQATGNTWVNIELPQSTVVTKLHLRGAAALGTITKLAIEGSDLGSSYTEIISRTNITGSFNLDLVLNNTVAYKHYRILITLASGSTVNLAEVEITGMQVTSFSKQYTAPNPPLKWENYQRYLVQVPSTPDSIGVTTNTFMNLDIDTILQPSRKYELVYWNNKFYAREVV